MPDRHYLARMDFAGKKFAVIGASGVLGGQMVQALQAAGASVSCIIGPRATLAAHMADLPNIAADIRDRASISAALTSLGGEFDGIINAAGVVAFGAIDEMPAVAVEQLFATNAIGTMNVLAAAKSNLNEGGVCASFTGVAADMAVMGMSAYCASKVAAKMAMSIAAREWRKSGLRVLDIRAPHTETGLVERAIWGQAPKMPAGKAPADVAARVVAALQADETDLPAEAFA